MSFASDLAWKLITVERTAYRTEFDERDRPVSVAYTYTIAGKEPKAALIALAIAQRSDETKQPVSAKELKDMGFTASTVSRGLKILSELPDVGGVMVLFASRNRARTYYLGGR